MTALDLKPLLLLLGDVRMTNTDMGRWFYRLTHGIFPGIFPVMFSCPLVMWQYSQMEMKSFNLVVVFKGEANS